MTIKLTGKKCRNFLEKTVDRKFYMLYDIKAPQKRRQCTLTIEQIRKSRNKRKESVNNLRKKRNTTKATAEVGSQD
jgi:hypothetical protein